MADQVDGGDGRDARDDERQRGGEAGGKSRAAVQVRRVKLGVSAAEV
jgi:hypothetical protein